MRIKFLLFSLFILLQITNSLLFSDTIQIKFNNGNNMQYNVTNVELYNGVLELSPTAWFWTNTPGKITNCVLGALLFQDSKGDLLYSTDYFGGMNIYRSSDYGNTWTNVNGYNSFAQIIEASDHNLYGTVYVRYNVFKSHDNGMTWNSILTNVPGSAYHGGICEDSSHSLYTSLRNFTSNNVFRSSDYGVTWTNIYTEIGASPPGPLFLWLYTLNNDNLLGMQWGSGNAPTGICISSNHGYNWTLILALSNLSFNGLVKANDNSYYLYGTAPGIMKSQDGGRTFAPISAPGCSGLIEADNNVFYKAYSPFGITGAILRSYDQCATWQALPNLMIGSANFNQYLSTCSIIQAIDRKIYIAGATNAGAGVGYVFKSGYVSSDQCIITPNIQGSVKQWLSYTKSDALNGGNINYEFASTSDGGVTWSSWLSLSNANLQSVKCLGIGQDFLKVRVTLYSLNHNTTPQVNWISLQYDSGYSTSLNNVVIAPNPFKPGSINTITFFNLTGNTEIKVYTITGRLINILNTTYNKYVWDARDSHGRLLAPGVYICVITDSSGQNVHLQLMIAR